MSWMPDADAGYSILDSGFFLRLAAIINTDSYYCLAGYGGED